MDVFKLRDAVVDEYREYVESFVRVLDPRLDDFVRSRLAAGMALVPPMVRDRSRNSMDRTASAGVGARAAVRDGH